MGGVVAQCLRLCRENAALNLINWLTLHTANILAWLYSADEIKLRGLRESV